MKFITIIFARMDSQRLPGKVLMDLSGKPVLYYVLERVKNINISEVVIATSTRKIDDPIVDYANQKKVKVFRGASDDVLDRAIKCAKYFSANCVLRICGDSPFVSFELANQAIEIMKEKIPDIVTTNCPRSWPIGSSVELATIETLETIKLKST